MAFETNWENTTPPILRLTYTGQWHWDDVRQSRRLVNQMLDNMNYPVAVVVEWKTENWVPPNVKRNLFELDLDATHPRISLLVLVLKSRLFQSLGHFYLESQGRCTVTLARSYDQARAIIEQHNL